jgi:Transposase, Mutator family
MLDVCIKWVVCIGLLIGTFFPYANAQGVTGGKNAPIVTVIADGLGATIDSAVQNAAQNALTQVVGSFVDTETQVAMHSEIAEGIRRQTRDISSKTREYSQGSIKSFGVLDSGQDGAIVHVTAKVAVQVEVLHEQLKQALVGTTSVSKGLFAQAAAEQTQQTDADGMFIDRIVMPLTKGAGLSLQVGTPAKFDIDAAHLPCRTMSIPPAPPTMGEPLKPTCPQPVESFFRNRSLNVFTPAVAQCRRPVAPPGAKAGRTDDDAEADVLAFTTFPKEHRSNIHSTNPLERLNGEIKRRTDVVGIFPNEAAIIRLVGAILLEQNDEWAVQRRYMTLETLGSISDTATVSLSAVAT